MRHNATITIEGKWAPPLDFDALRESMGLIRANTKAGDKIIFTDDKQGILSLDRRHAHAKLILGQTYVVEKIEVTDSDTRVWLEGVKDGCFNGVLFRNAGRPATK